MKREHIHGGLALCALGLLACSFQIRGVELTTADGGADLAARDGVTDLGTDDQNPPDLAGLCTPGGPTSGCSMDGLSLISCQGTTPMSTACDDGCSSEVAPHCKRVDPGGAATPEDYELAGLSDVTIMGTAVFNTDTGAVTATPIDRSGGIGVQVGIGFRIGTQAGGGDVGIFSFKSLAIASGALVNVIGAKPLVLVAQGNITIDGAIDVQGSCMIGSPIAGGGMGGTPTANAAGNGSGAGAGGGGGFSALGGGGGGGGGFGEAGGTGAAGNTAATAGNAGPLFGDLTVADPILVGGSGGGAGGGMGGLAIGGAGGGGGGAVQLASNNQISLLGSAIIQASGCHGATAGGSGGGGGAGAGGAILIEGRTVMIANGAVLAANGGGGGGGGNGQAGEDGPPNTDHARGGQGGNNATNGGDGGHTTMLPGKPAQNPGAGDVRGGGGGGGVGRIALKSKSGTVSTASADLSPNIGEMVTGHTAPGTVGMIQFR